MKRKPPAFSTSGNQGEDTSSLEGSPAKKKVAVDPSQDNQSSQSVTGAYFSEILGTTQQEGEDVEGQIWLNWMQENRGPTEEIRQYLYMHLPTYYSDKLPEQITNPLPEDVYAFYQAFLIIGQWQEFLQQSMLQQQLEQHTPVETTTTTQTTRVAAPRSHAAPDEIYASLKPYVQFIRGIQRFDLAKAFDHTGNDKEKNGPDAIDWKKSAAMIRQVVVGYVAVNYFKEAWKLLTEWNAITVPDFEISPDDFKWPRQFDPQASDDTSSGSANSTATFSILGRQCQLSEREGVKGGYHTIFDVPNDISAQLGSAAIVRAPKSQSPRRAVEAGLKNRQRIEEMGYTVPEIFNMPNRFENNDGFYIVEFVDGEFDPSNREHRRQVGEAFADMLSKGDRFPFDFRIDNVKFKGDTMVVIDFSEGGEGAGDVSFWKDSLIEFCWKKTKSRSDDRATSGSEILDRLIADAKFSDPELGMRLPSSLGQSLADYDGSLLNDIWKGLPSDAKDEILGSLRT